MSSTLTGGNVIVDVIGGDELLFSQNFACPEHGACIDELSPRMFSFNNPFGACPTCTGLGIFLKVDPNLIIPNKKAFHKRRSYKGKWMVKCRQRHNSRNVLSGTR